MNLYPIKGDIMDLTLLIFMIGLVFPFINGMIVQVLDVVFKEPFSTLCSIITLFIPGIYLSVKYGIWYALVFYAGCFTTIVTIIVIILMVVIILTKFEKKIEK